MRPTVVVVSHTHWDREWYQPFEVFRSRLCDMVAALLDILDRDPQFRHFMLDGQTVCIDDILELHPAWRPRLQAHIDAGRISIGPWYVLQDEFLVGAEAIVRNLSEGLRSARRFGRAMPIGYLPDAFGHIAQMPRILRGFGIETAVVWRGVGDRAPGSEWRWRAPSGAEVLCLFLPGGYGNAHRLGSDGDKALARLRSDVENVLPLSRAAVLLWMNGNDHQPAEAELPALLAGLGRARPDVELEHASLERAAALVRARVDVAALPVVDGELRRATATVPVLSGVWSVRSWQKSSHDRAQALLVRFAEPFVALAGPSLERRDALAHAWRTLLQCQPHDSICGCSIDDVHRDIDDRLRRVDQMGRTLLDEAVYALVGARTPDFTLHEAIAIVNPHPFASSGMAEVELQRHADAIPFRLVGPAGEVPYDIVSRWPSEGPDHRPTEWLRVRVDARDLPPHGLRVLALAPGAPTAAAAAETTLAVRPIAGGLEIVDAASGLCIVHTFEDEGDRGDLYDFCPRDDAPPRSSRDSDFGIQLSARAVGRRVDIDVEIDNHRPDHRLRARFELSTPPASMWTETAFGWLERATTGTHPVSAVTVTAGEPPFAIGGPGLHEVERAADGALLLTLFRAIGWMSRGDLSTRPGHAGYNVQTPDAQGIGRLRFRYTLAVGADAVREIDAGIIGPRATALERGQPSDRALLSVEPPTVRLSILKRADDGQGFILRLCASPREPVTARVRFARPLRRAWWSDLDERIGADLEISGARDELAVPIATHEVVTLRFA
jgi:alpha-mannosidase/mannosylglycerate hydrolase